MQQAVSLLTEQADPHSCKQIVTQNTCHRGTIYLQAVAQRVLLHCLCRSWRVVRPHNKTVQFDEVDSTATVHVSVAKWNLRALTCSNKASPTPSIGSKSTPTSCPVSPMILCATKLQPPGAAPKSTTLKPGFNMRCFCEQHWAATATAIRESRDAMVQY
eukprot:14705-Heterococcus_DN1.PRE.2